MKKLFLAWLTISLVQWGESIDANACQPSPCMHGTCFSGPAGYLCVCDQGYTGIHCDSSIGGIETCLSCPARLTDVPCTHVQKCSSGQQCFARILATSSGDLLHEYGCKDSQLCGASSVNGRRETQTSMTSRQTQTGFPLCERCCSGTICNMNMCGQAPNISVSGGPTCYSCSNHTTKDSCTDIQQCPAGQVCQLVPKIYIVTHTYHFESSCAVLADCEAKVAALTQGILGRKRDMPCSMRCCNSTLCNQLSCGQVTTPVADPCSSNPCQRGTCTRLNGDFQCQCPSGYSGKTCDMGPLPTDCKDIINRPHLFSNRGDGVYTIMLPRSHTVLRVFCNMTHDSGGWTAFQRRVANSPDFNRNLAEYKTGFGDINSNFWMGLENLKEIVDLGPTYGKFYGVVVGANDSSLHEQCTFTLRIISLSGAPSFTIETEANATFSCTGSIIPVENGQVDAAYFSPHVATFATYDRDTTDRCAANLGGGWWYYGCVPSHGSLPTNTYNNSINCESHFYPGGQLPGEDDHCAPLNLYSDSPSQAFDRFSMTYIDMMIRRNN